ncbi:MAG: tRNA uridine-5-carboxymethylaminomethyl(34) synthesis GTPase MnmE [Bacteroidales bacterium]|nr:tRNA uridine-5-carboxymethylaminomethyl(34) synthesis GTPase MnmE [Bacteroidales bacterium]
MNLRDTIVAAATGNITSALGIIRMSGADAVDIISEVFIPVSEKKFADVAKGGRLYYGRIVNADINAVKSKDNKSQDVNNAKSNDHTVDEVVVSVFKAPHSFTGEDTVEISHHGSPYIQQEIIKLLLSAGARLADKGEFSLRAFLNGKMNLSQAEAVADLIQSDNKSSHDIAMDQLRGGYNSELKSLRQRFLKIASLLELEIDFSAEQEVFVDRDELVNLLTQTKEKLTYLVNSFRQGNAFKNGIPVAIAGKPNSGKSTLMNAILKDERSIVSSVEGTTRDTIEETINVNGVNIRFIDTAGIRESDNEIEKEGIKRSYDAINKAQTVLYLIDSSVDDAESADYQLKFLKQDADLTDKKLILVVNKSDISCLTRQDREKLQQMDAVFVSAKKSDGLEELLKLITADFNVQDVSSKVFVSNIRHYDALKNALDETSAALDITLSGLSSDLISENIRSAMDFIGQITGEITTEDVLTNIFSSFCIGK